MAVEQPRTGDSSEQRNDTDTALRMQILSTEHWSLLSKQPTRTICIGSSA
jgi:hypothetical protein